MILGFVRHKMLSLDHASAKLVLLRYLHIFQMFSFVLVLVLLMLVLMNVLTRFGRDIETEVW